ncbi:MAG: DUF177 domain-containing protein [Bacteroides sp.]|nr:DUF177 domain-containing protein [Bacteroides sp.]
MSKRGLYTVRVSGLVDGNHDFSFELDHKFFASLEEAEIEKGSVRADVVLEKKIGLLALHFHLEGEVEVLCDRCLEPFVTEIFTDQKIFVKLGDSAGEIEDDVIMIHRDDHEIEIAQYLYEFILLGLPYQRIHSDDEDGVPECNPEMIRKLEEHQVLEEKNDQTDPRWDTLKGIIDK